MGLNQHVADSSVTEMDVRIVTPVHNVVSITFVHIVSKHPKMLHFGRMRTEYGHWRLTCFKFRFLKGPPKGPDFCGRPVLTVRFFPFSETPPTRRVIPPG